MKEIFNKLFQNFFILLVIFWSQVQATAFVLKYFDLIKSSWWFVLTPFLGFITFSAIYSGVEFVIILLINKINKIKKNIFKGKKL